METAEQFLERVSPNDEHGIRADLKATRAYKHLLKLMEMYANRVSKNNSYTVLATVPYQCCPVCNGRGEVVADGFTSSVYQKCTVCNGQKIIPEAIIPQVPEEAL